MDIFAPQAGRPRLAASDCSRKQSPVCDAFKDIVNHTVESAEHYTRNWIVSHGLTSQELFAVAAYQITYDSSHEAYLQEPEDVDEPDDWEEHDLDTNEGRHPR
jgi:hypothetical protein